MVLIATLLACTHGAPPTAPGPGTPVTWITSLETVDREPPRPFPAQVSDRLIVALRGVGASPQSAPIPASWSTLRAPATRAQDMAETCAAGPAAWLIAVARPEQEVAGRWRWTLSVDVGRCLGANAPRTDHWTLPAFLDRPTMTEQDALDAVSGSLERRLVRWWTTDQAAVVR